VCRVCDYLIVTLIIRLIQKINRAILSIRNKLLLRLQDMTSSADIVIIGGGIIGSSIAYHLALKSAGRVVVIERDASYERAATPRSNGGIRRLFSLPENIEMASYGLQFYRDFASTMSIDKTPVDIDFRHQGYLFVSDAGGEKQMEENYALQLDMGVDAEALDRVALKARFPSINSDDIKFAVLSANDAWVDPHAALMGFRNKARQLGVKYIQAEVQELQIQGGVIKRACCSEFSIDASVFVNACGAWCTELCKPLNIHLPVSPMSRESYYFDCAQSIEPLPFIKTETDLAFRPDAAGTLTYRPNISSSLCGHCWPDVCQPCRN